MGQDPVQFRRDFLKDKRLLAVLDKVAEVGQWGKAMPHGRRRASRSTASTRARSRSSSRSTAARPRPAGRSRDGVTGPRVTKALVVVDAGLADQPARPGGADDRRHPGRHRAGADLQPAHRGRHPARGQLGQLLLHAPVEHPAGRRGHRHAGRPADSPGGAGELGVAPAMAAVACAYARATGTLPTTSRSTTARSASSRCRSSRPPRSRRRTASTAPSRDSRI